MISDLVLRGRQSATRIHSHCLRGEGLATSAGIGVHSPVAWDGISGLLWMRMNDCERLRQGGG
jgi:hypothetical protein